MAILRVSHEKVGPSDVVLVDVPLDGAPSFPPVCPCCVEPVDEGAHLTAACEHLPPVAVPACRTCERHNRIEDRIAGVVAPIMLTASVLAVTACIAHRGAVWAASKGASAGWQAFSALAALRFPFSSPINFGITALGAGVTLLVLLAIYAAIMRPILKLLSKPSCLWFNQAARTTRSYSSQAGGHFRRFIFENPAYAERFIQLNRPGPPPATGA